ncbi:uncharacterized protein [Argopecten irradians]|uniref:uncharacterized protein n=1 Tax=Argopecten irradians TaxID=31199 RepID=UPI00371696DF
MDIYICDEKQRHCKMMTVRQNKFSKTGEIYIHGIHMTNPSDFRYGDELFKVGSELLADTTKETIQNHFHFDAEPNGRLTKTLTIRRTENGKTDEIDVRVVLFIKPEQASITYAKPGRRTIDRVEKKEEVKTQINHTKDGKTAEKEDDTVLVENIKSPEYTNMAHTKPVLPGRQPRRRTIDIVEKKEVEVEKVLIKTEYQTKYLKVGADASVVGDWLDPQNKDKFWFHLEPFNVFYESPSGPLICCKIKCDKFWLKAKHTVDEGIELELTEEDTNVHTSKTLKWP